MLFPHSNHLFKSLSLCFCLWLTQFSPDLSASGTTCNSNYEIKVLGLVEFVAINSPGSPQILSKALLDTGATHSAIHARNIVTQENRTGSSTVRFEIKDDQTGQWKTVQRPLTRYARIKTHHGSAIKRMVVTLPVQVGNLAGTSEFYLMNRQAFQYPVLLGRSFLRDRAVVDVSQQNIANRPLCMNLADR